MSWEWWKKKGFIFWLVGIKDIQNVDEEYYSFILEQKAKGCCIEIFFYNDRRCAITLLHEGMKGKKHAAKKRGKRRLEVCDMIDILHNRIKSSVFSIVASWYRSVVTATSIYYFGPSFSKSLFFFSQVHVYLVSFPFLFLYFTSLFLSLLLFQTIRNKKKTLLYSC